MNHSQQIDEIWNSYRLTTECLKVAQRAIKLNHFDSLKGTSFADPPRGEIAEIKTSLDNASDHAIFSMWAVFERALFDYLVLHHLKQIAPPDLSILAQKIYEKIENDIEYWRIDEVLEIYKSIIHGDLLGSAKQVKQYRDWLAHKNPKKPRPPNITPNHAYATLSAILKQLDVTPIPS